MDFLDCKICNIPYDEEERRPRNAPCGHEWCSACISELIEDSVFLCPKCRQKNKVNVPDDLLVNYGLMDVIRAFKTQHISLPQETEPVTSGASKVDVCKAHHKKIGYRCLKCHRWLCVGCLNSHTQITGCFTISTATAMQNIKEENNKNIDVLLSSFEEGTNGLLTKIQEHNNEIEENSKKIKELKQKSKMHENEIQKIQHLIKQGNQQKEDILTSKKHLNAVELPHALMDGIEVMEEMKQELRSWSIRNLGAFLLHDDILYDISKALKENRDAYVEMVIKDQKRHGKLSQYEDKIYFHTFRAHTVTPNSMCMPFANIQKLFPPTPSLVFLEFSMGGIVKGLVHLRLEEDLPNIREHMVQLVMGQQEHTLVGTVLSDKDADSMNSSDLPFKNMRVTADSKAKYKAKRGDVAVFLGRGYLSTIYFQIDEYEYTFQSNRVIGCIESGMHIIQECYDNDSHDVVITNCGLVLEQN